MLRPRRLYLRARKLFRNYIQRFPAFYPKMYEEGVDGGRITPILNVEELATIFHFPTKIILPEVPWIGAKPGGPPVGLPTEAPSAEAPSAKAPPAGLPVEENE